MNTKFIAMETNIWKSKSIEKTKANKEQRKRILELKVSRDSWKEKAMDYKSRVISLEKSLKKTKLLIEKIVSQKI